MKLSVYDCFAFVFVDGFDTPGFGCGVMWQCFVYVLGICTLLRLVLQIVVALV